MTWSCILKLLTLIYACTWWKIMTYYFMSREKLVRNLIFIYPLVWWKLGCISLLNIPWFMSWLYLSPTLIVRFLQDKTKRPVTLKCKIWQLQDFFSRSINSLTILLSILFCGNMKKHVHKSASQWNQRLLRWHDEPIYLTWFQDFIFSFFTII